MKRIGKTLLVVGLVMIYAGMVAALYQQHACIADLTRLVNSLERALGESTITAARTRQAEAKRCYLATTPRVSEVQ